VGALRGLLAVAENYPQLKASENVLALQPELATTEDRLQTARRFYNANVYNRRVQSVPSNLIAQVFGFHGEKFFEVEEAIRADRRRGRRATSGAAGALVAEDEGERSDEQEEDRRSSSELGIRSQERGRQGHSGGQEGRCGRRFDGEESR